MPIDIESDAWSNAERYDPLRTAITELLSDNREQAFSIREIEEHLLDNHSDLFPDQLTGDKAVGEAKAARQSIIATVLEDRFWHLQVSFRYVSGGDDHDSGLYFTWDGSGISPVAELDEVSTPENDNSLSILSSRFKQIEEDIDEDMADLEERIDFIEFRIHEELGAY